jgi:hypothetical protein
MGGQGQSVAVLSVRPSNVGNGGNRFPGYAEAIEDVVPGNVVRDEPEEWSERAGLAEGARARKLSNGLDLVA